MKEIKINIIGCGLWGPNLVRNFLGMPDVEVGVVVDLDPERRARIEASCHGLKTSDDAIAATTDPEADAVIVITPVSTHFDLVKQALEAGKHVFVEKPMCSSSDEARELIALAEAQDKILMVGHVFVFNPGVNWIAELIQRGELGRILYIDAVRTNLGPVRTDVNALWDLASHDISIFNFWLGDRALSVQASGRACIGDQEDVVFAEIHYEDGILAHVHASWLNPQKVRHITVVGDKKMAVWDDIDLGRSVQVYDRGINMDITDGYTDTFGSHRLSYNMGAITIPHVSGDEPLLSECRHFIDCLLGTASCRQDGNAGLDVIRILEAADDSIAQGGRAIDVVR